MDKACKYCSHFGLESYTDFERAEFDCLIEHCHKDIMLSAHINVDGNLEVFCGLTKGLGMFVKDDEVCVKHNTTTSVAVNYCPMCGRKLEKALKV